MADLGEALLTARADLLGVLNAGFDSTRREVATRAIERIDTALAACDAVVERPDEQARAERERDQDRDPHHPNSLACRLAEAEARSYALEARARDREKALEEAEERAGERKYDPGLPAAARLPERPDEGEWADDEWHTDENGQIIGGAPPNFVFVAKSVAERPDEGQREATNCEDCPQRMAYDRRACAMACPVASSTKEKP